ncbi:MAG: ATP synthase F1 subunit epsilon, partial [Chloroflexi bacterium]
MADKPTMKLKIVSPERVLFDDEVNEVVMNAKAGQITILPNHVPLVSILVAGDVLIRKYEDVSTEEGSGGVGEIPLVISGGFVEVAQNQVVILADTAEH